MGLLFNRKKGFSLLEIVLAIGLTGFVVVGIVGTITEYQRSILVKGERTQGYEYLQEAQKALDTLKYDGLVGYATGVPLGLSLGSTWSLSPGVETLGDYQRSVTLSQPDADTVQAVINISWIGKNGRGDNLSAQVTYKSWQALLNPCVGTQAQNVTIDTTNWAFDTVGADQKRIIRGIRLINNEPTNCTSIQVDRINPLLWEDKNLTSIKIGPEGLDKNDSGLNKWSSGPLAPLPAPGNNLDITDTGLTGTSELLLEFDGQMSGQSLAFTLVFGDGSILTSAVISSPIDPCLANAQAENVTLNASAWTFDSVGSNIKRIVRGINLTNNTGSTCTVTVDRIDPLLWQSNNLTAVKIGDSGFDKNNVAFNVWTGNQAPLASPGNNIDITNTNITNTKELALQYATQMSGQTITFTIRFTDGSTLTDTVTSLADPCALTQAENTTIDTSSWSFDSVGANPKRIIRGIRLINNTGTTCGIEVDRIDPLLWANNNLEVVKIGDLGFDKNNVAFNVWAGNQSPSPVPGNNIDITNTTITNTKELALQYNAQMTGQTVDFTVVFSDGSTLTGYVTSSSDPCLANTQAQNSTLNISSWSFDSEGANPKRIIRGINLTNNTGSTCTVTVDRINPLLWQSNNLTAVKIGDSGFDKNNVAFNVWTGNLAPLASPGNNIDVTNTNITNTKELALQYAGQMTGQTVTFTVVFSDGSTLSSGTISSPLDPCVANTQAQNFSMAVGPSYPDWSSSGIPSNNRIFRGLDLTNTIGSTCTITITEIQDLIWTNGINLNSIKIGPELMDKNNSGFNKWTGNLSRDTTNGRDIDISDTVINNVQELLFQFSGSIYNSNLSFKLLFSDGSVFTQGAFGITTVNCVNQANASTIDSSLISMSSNRIIVQNIWVRNNSGCRVRVTNINNITWSSSPSVRFRRPYLNGTTILGSQNATSPYNANTTDVDIDSEMPLNFEFLQSVPAGSTLSFTLVFSDGTTKTASLIIP